MRKDNANRMLKHQARLNVMLRCCLSSAKIILKYDKQNFLVYQLCLFNVLLSFSCLYVNYR